MAERAATARAHASLQWTRGGGAEEDEAKMNKEGLTMERLEEGKGGLVGMSHVGPARVVGKREGRLGENAMQCNCARLLGRG